MMTLFFGRLFAGLTLVLISAAASAAPIVITDEMDTAATYMRGDYSAYASANFVNRAAGGRHWGDELYSAGHRFDTSQITVDRGANTIVFTLRTIFNGNDLGARYADIFIDTGTPGVLDSFDYAISLGGQTMPIGVYSVDGQATSNDIWGNRSGYVYGGYSQFKTSSPDFNAAMAMENPVRVTSGTHLDDFSVVVSTMAAGGGYMDLVVSVTAASLNLFNAMDLFWATGDCANDVIWGTALTMADADVPAPPALPLLLGGVLLLLFFRARSQCRTAP